MWKVHFCYWLLPGGFYSLEFFYGSPFKLKSIVARQNLPNKACRLTCCHVPFRSIFPLEKHFPFRQLVLVATRS
jgi:hypothetical protein